MQERRLALVEFILLLWLPMAVESNELPSSNSTYQWNPDEVEVSKANTNRMAAESKDGTGETQTVNEFHHPGNFSQPMGYAPYHYSYPGTMGHPPGYPHPVPYYGPQYQPFLQGQAVQSKQAWQPGQPVYPGQSIYPRQPAYFGQPVHPANPGRPQGPGPGPVPQGQSIQPAQPAYAVPVQPRQALQPSHQGQPVQPGQYVQPGHLMQPGQHVQPGQHEQPGQHVQPDQHVQPGQPVQPGQSVHLGQYVQPGQPIPQHHPIPQGQPACLDQTMQTGQSAPSLQNVQPVYSSQYVQPVHYLNQSSQPGHPVYQVHLSQPGQNTFPGMVSNSVNLGQHVQDMQTVQINQPTPIQQIYTSHSPINPVQQSQIITVSKILNNAKTNIKNMHLRTLKMVPRQLNTGNSYTKYSSAYNVKKKSKAYENATLNMESHIEVEYNNFNKYRRQAYEQMKSRTFPRRTLSPFVETHINNLKKMNVTDLDLSDNKIVSCIKDLEEKKYALQKRHKDMVKDIQLKITKYREQMKDVHKGPEELLEAIVGSKDVLEVWRSNHPQAYKALVEQFCGRFRNSMARDIRRMALHVTTKRTWSDNMLGRLNKEREYFRRRDEMRRSGKDWYGGRTPLDEDDMARFENIKGRRANRRFWRPERMMRGSFGRKERKNDFGKGNSRAYSVDKQKYDKSRDSGWITSDSESESFDPKKKDSDFRSEYFSVQSDNWKDSSVSSNQIASPDKDEEEEKNKPLFVKAYRDHQKTLVDGKDLDYEEAQKKKTELAKKRLAKLKAYEKLLVKKEEDFRVVKDKKNKLKLKKDNREKETKKYSKKDTKNEKSDDKEEKNGKKDKKNEKSYDKEDKRKKNDKDKSEEK